MPTVQNLIINNITTSINKCSNDVPNIARPLKIGAPKVALLNTLKAKSFRCKKP